MEKEIESERRSVRDIYGRLNRDTRSVQLQNVAVESSDFNGSLWIEFASELGIIVLDIASLLLKCSLHYLLNSLTARRHICWAKSHQYNPE